MPKDDLQAKLEELKREKEILQLQLKVKELELEVEQLRSVKPTPWYTPAPWYLPIQNPLPTAPWYEITWGTGTAAEVYDRAQGSPAQA